MQLGLRSRPGAVALAALTLTAAMAGAPPARAQYSDFVARCQVDAAAGPAQIDACVAALRYDPGNPALLTRLGDAMLAAHRPGGAFDAYTDALRMRPDLPAARAGRDEALRRITGTTQLAAVVVPATPVVVAPMAAQPVAAMPFDGRWSGRVEPRGQSFAVSATVVGGHLRLHYEDSTDRVTLEGSVDAAGHFSGKGFLKDKNRSAGDGGEPLAISGRFIGDRFEGTGSAGSKATTMRLSRDG